MSIKRKLILMGICFAIIIIIFTVNVVRRINKNDTPDDTTPRGNIIIQSEAYRLFSYLEYDKAKREALPMEISYSDPGMSGWYDTYVNAIWKMGLIEENITGSPSEALTYGMCKKMMDQLIIDKPKLQDIYQKLSFDFLEYEDKMLTSDFLELYDAILSILSSEDIPIQRKTIFVLGSEVTDDGRERIVADTGRYYYDHARDYEAFFIQSPQEAEQTDDSDDTTKQGNAQEEKKDQKNNQKSGTTAFDITGEYIKASFTDQSIQVLVSGQEIISVTAITQEKTILHNVWMKEGKSQQIDAYINGIDKSFSTKYPLSSEISRVVGDITVENKVIIQISVKPDTIQGKVLLTGDDFIEIEGYGKVPLDPDYKIYKIYGELSMEPTSSILVGYEATDFVVSDGKISAALIKEGIKAENIRVLLNTTDYKSVYHDTVKFTVNTDFTISDKDNEKSYKAGDVVTVKPGDDLLSNGRIKITPASDNGKIEILSIKRSYGNPKYRGMIEISEGEEGLLIVNELSLEEYLYAVIPSEMPTYYGVEALKVQAICARTYAYKHLMANSLNNYGAHVDDSVTYQVYNNIAENEDAILAVKDTYGKIIEYDGSIITAYYFSTSCGHTTGPQCVWANGTDTPYLTGKLMTVEDGESTASKQNEGIYEDLSKEDNFRSFLSDDDYTTYDSEFNWYRWHVTMDIDHIKANIDNILAKRYKANPDMILTMTSPAKGDKKAVYESEPVDTVGDIEDIQVSKREIGGIISELIIKGSKKTILVKTEYNIRALLAPTQDTVIRKDQSEVSELTLLPSAYFVIDKNKKSKELSSITLTGGGYGHGVGMSQNGVKALTDSGKNYEEIIKYFYQGTDLGFIYE